MISLLDSAAANRAPWMSGAGPLSPPIASIAIFQAMAPPSPETSLARNPMPLFVGFKNLLVFVVTAIGTNAMREFGFLATRAECHPSQGELPVSATFIAACFRGLSLRNWHQSLLASLTRSANLS